MSDTYRVGNHQPQNLYRGQQYIGVMFDPADTALIARVLNEQSAALPLVFRDESGGRWYLREDGRYRVREGDVSISLDAIKEMYGTWDEGSRQHPPFRDRDGHWWHWDEAAGGYNLTADGEARWTVAEIREAYGTWVEGSDA